MIQLASRADPAASRAGFRPAANDGKANSFEVRRRTGHAWPFISQMPQGNAQASATTETNDSGS